jgi:hypothetical protein
MIRKFLILANLLLAACSAPIESPVIYFSNASAHPIKDVRCNWVGKNVLTLPALMPGDSRSQSFYISGSSEFFGEVVVSWVNSQGESVKKEFLFREKNLPSIDDHTTYNYVQLYFDQFDLEVVSSDVADLGGKNRRMESLMKQYKEQYSSGHPSAPATSLIRVQPVSKDSSVPSWISNSY